MQREGRSLCILIIEDNHDVAEMLRVLLGLYGHKVEVAYSGAAGLETARQFRPDVVICDTWLPEMDGYRVAAELRRNTATATVRLIALSGSTLEKDRQRSREAGFDLCLTKPLDPEKLLQSL